MIAADLEPVPTDPSLRGMLESSEKNWEERWAYLPEAGLEIDPPLVKAIKESYTPHVPLDLVVQDNAKIQIQPGWDLTILHTRSHTWGSAVPPTRWRRTASAGTCCFRNRSSR